MQLLVLKIFMVSAMKISKFKAYTLLELLLVIGIIATMLTVVIISTKTNEKTRVNNTIKLLKADIIATKNRAISNNEKDRIEFNYFDNSYSYELNGDKIVVKLGKNVVLKRISNCYSFEFTGNGSPSNIGSGTIGLLIDEADYVITIAPVTGKLSFRKTNEDV